MTPTQMIVEKVAEADDVSPEELDPPLIEVIDPDALDDIFRNTATADRRGGQVTFPYRGYMITVSGDGNISIDPLEE